MLLWVGSFKDKAVSLIVPNLSSNEDFLALGEGFYVSQYLGIE